MSQKSRITLFSRKAKPVFKGQCYEIFASGFIKIHLPQAPENYIRVGSNFFENPQRYSQVRVRHRYQRHGWQKMGTISDCWHLKVNLKQKFYLSVNSLTQRCPNKIIKTFLIEEFFHLPLVSTTPMMHLELQIQYLREFSRKKN